MKMKEERMKIIIVWMITVCVCKCITVPAIVPATMTGITTTGKRAIPGDMAGITHGHGTPIPAGIIVITHGAMLLIHLIQPTSQPPKHLITNPL